MKKNSFTGKSIPVDFFKMSVKDLALLLGIIEELLLNAETDGKNIVGNIKEITVPIKFLSRVFGVKFAESVQIIYITEAIKKIKEELMALENLEEIFFSRVNAKFKATGTKSKTALKLVKSKGVYAGAWEN